jgi:hypothetical protein
LDRNWDCCSRSSGNSRLGDICNTSNNDGAISPWDVCVDIWTVGRVADLGLVVLLGSHIGTMIRKRHSKLAITFKSPKLDVVN